MSGGTIEAVLPYSIPFGNSGRGTPFRAICVPSLLYKGSKTTPFIALFVTSNIILGDHRNAKNKRIGKRIATCMPLGKAKIYVFGGCNGLLVGLPAATLFLTIHFATSRL